MKEDVPVIPSGKNPTVAQMEEQKKKGVFWDNAKAGWVSAKKAGVLDWLFGQIGANKPTARTSGGGGANPAAPKKGMTKGVKIAIGVGILVVLGIAVHKLLKK